MRSNEVFAQMTPEQATAFLEELVQKAKPVAALALNAAAQAFKLRPQFIRKQPRARQASWMRQALGRNVGAAMAEEVLAAYFLEHQKEMLIELLDALGIKHEEGQLVEETPPAQPDRGKLEQVVADFRKGADPERRELLLRAFAAQAGIDWPELERILGVAG
jgi:hypothetical protein